MAYGIKLTGLADEFMAKLVADISVHKSPKKGELPPHGTVRDGYDALIRAENAVRGLGYQPGTGERIQGGFETPEALWEAVDLVVHSIGIPTRSNKVLSGGAKSSSVVLRNASTNVGFVTHEKNIIGEGLAKALTEAAIARPNQIQR